MRVCLLQREFQDDRGDCYWSDYHLPNPEFEEWCDFRSHMERHYDPGVYRVVLATLDGGVLTRKFRLKAITTTTMVGVDD